MVKPEKQKITPFLWIDGIGEEVAKYYLNIFPGSKIIHQSPLITSIEVFGQAFSIMTAGPHDPFTDAVSFYVNCKDQKEVDYYWNSFLETGGKESMCGWLQDKYGVRWQIIPEALSQLANDPDPNKSKNVVEAMLKMRKIDVSELEKAYNS